MNVTINLLNVIDVPIILPLTLDVNESYVGPIAGSQVPVFNPDSLPLTWAITTGNPVPPLFVIDPVYGNFTVLSPGAVYAVSTYYSLLVESTYDPGDASVQPIVS